MRYTVVFLLLGYWLNSIGQQTNLVTPFEIDSDQTTTFQQTIAFYQTLSQESPLLEIREAGPTDTGFPLHLVLITSDSTFDPEQARLQGKAILLINNAIHPGEPEGVDASMLLARDLVQQERWEPLLERLVVLIIPYYNIGGGLNRGCCSRANQNGPREYGFRGNARNLDLNRDFIKCDSKNARTFTHLFSQWDPDVFLDNHTSNGADYPYTMTLLATQADKLGPICGEYLRREMLPELYRSMEAAGEAMCPYVNVWGSTPDKGIPGFYDSPRYASGYAALHHCLALVPETHMLKPFPRRVAATRTFMEKVLAYTGSHSEAIQRVRREARKAARLQDTFPLHWEIDTTLADTILFSGYSARQKTSEVTGAERLWYDRSKPWTAPIPYQNYFRPVRFATKPIAYLVPQAWDAVVSHLVRNGVQVRQLTEDISLEVELSRITDFKTRQAYEGHYLHYDTQTQRETARRQYHRGDYVVFTDQRAVRFLLETLEPEAPDSYFNWNFFDSILGQKEYYSAYVFEDIAAEWLKENPAIRKELEEKKAQDPSFSENPSAQLDWVYRKSPYHEPTVALYPVGRLMSDQNLPLE